MSAIPFTDRELKRAWRELSAVAEANNRQNPHRLLMFYAVECGLKAIWLKRHNKQVFNKQDIDKTGHDLRQLLKELKVGNELSLPQSLQLDPILQNGQQVPRTGDISILHQAWRYGGHCKNPDDNSCEMQLTNVLNWIKGELR